MAGFARYRQTARPPGAKVLSTYLCSTSARAPAVAYAPAGQVWTGWPVAAQDKYRSSITVREGRRLGWWLSRSSTDCLNSAILVSSQRRWPRNVGELPADRERWRGRQLHRVVSAGEILRSDPQVHLERGIRPLERDLLAGQLERVIADDPDLDRTLAEPAQAAAQGVVAGRVGHDVAIQMRPAEGRMPISAIRPWRARAASPTRARSRPSSLASAANGRPASGTGEEFSSRL